MSLHKSFKSSNSQQDDSNSVETNVCSENAIAISIISFIDSEGLNKKMEMNKRDEKVGK